jgi:peptide deformylase
MAKRDVIRMGHPTLQLVAELITPNQFQEDWFKEILIDLQDTMRELGGVGIAAPQINVSKQIALIEIPKENNRYGNLQATPLITFVNPKITALTEETMGYYEGCLSVPGLRGYVERPKKIRVEYLNELGIPQTIIAEDFLAIVFQHELDHLFGKVFVERMVDHSKLYFTEEFDLFHKNNIVLK